MKAKLVKIGNSKGIRIPQPLLKLSGLTEEVDLVVEGNTIVVRPSQKPREGWEKAATETARAFPADLMVDGDGMGLSSFDNEEWDW